MKKIIFSRAKNRDNFNFFLNAFKPSYNSECSYSKSNYDALMRKNSY